MGLRTQSKREGGRRVESAVVPTIVEGLGSALGVGLSLALFC